MINNYYFHNQKTLNISNRLIIRQLGIQPYEIVSSAMHYFTNQRNMTSIDEIWLVQHPQIFTQGKTSQNKFITPDNLIPLIESDRGGKITFHGPGQQIMYVLFNLHNRKFSVRYFISLLEKTVISTLLYFNIVSYSRIDAPGIYVKKDKICSLGLRIKKGCSLHGLALNVDMDLSPFSYIYPCGYKNLKMTQISHFLPNITTEEVSSILVYEFLKLFNITVVDIQRWNPLHYSM